MPPKDRFAANLKRLRTAAELTQKELGKRCDMHFSIISRLERAERDPQLETMAVLARGLGVPVADLVDGIPEAP